MKTSVLLVAFFILFKPVLPVLDYAINYDYISKVLCINKEKPQLKCNGKCHLMKEMAKTAETENSNSDKKNTVSTIEILFFQEIYQITFLSKPFFQKPQLNSFYCNFYNYLNCNSFFHPPTFIS